MVGHIYILTIRGIFSGNFCYLKIIAAENPEKMSDYIISSICLSHLSAMRKASSFIFSRFTFILGNKKFGESKSPEIRQSNRISSHISSPLPAWIYPKECNLCLKYRVQYKSKKYELYAAKNTIKAAAKAKNEMFYKEIKDLDLIAKEFKVHKHCYQQYTSGHAFSSRSNLADHKEMSSEESSYDTGKFNEVKEFVTDDILGLQPII